MKLDLQGLCHLRSYFCIHSWIIFRKLILLKIIILFVLYSSSKNIPRIYIYIYQHLVYFPGSRDPIKSRTTTGFLRWKTALFSCHRRSWRISWPNDGTTVQGKLEARRETREARRRRRGGARPCGRYDLWTFGGWKGGSSRLWRASRLLVSGRGMPPRGVARSSQGFLDWWPEIRRAARRPRRSNARTRWRSCARMAVTKRGWGGWKVKRRACRSEGRKGQWGRRKWTFGGEFARCSLGIGARIPLLRGENRATTVNRRAAPVGGGAFKWRGCAQVLRWSWNLVGEVTDAKPNLWWYQTLRILLARCQRWDVKRRIWPCCSPIVSFQEKDRVLWILASSFVIFLLGKKYRSIGFGVWVRTSDDKRNFIRRSFTAFDRLFDDCSLIVFVDRCSILVLKLRGYGSSGFV